MTLATVFATFHHWNRWAFPPRTEIEIQNPTISFAMSNVNCDSNFTLRHCIPSACFLAVARSKSHVYFFFFFFHRPLPLARRNTSTVTTGCPLRPTCSTFPLFVDGVSAVLCLSVLDPLISSGRALSSTSPSVQNPPLPPLPWGASAHKSPDPSS